ncbi:hypothetical protein D3C72_432880 [compost metagenome]
MSFTALAIARIWSGVVPQQPPVILIKPLSANSFKKAAVCSGVSSYSPKAFGKPAFGWAEMKVSATSDTVLT